MSLRTTAGQGRSLRKPVRQIHPTNWPSQMSLVIIRKLSKRGVITAVAVSHRLCYHRCRGVITVIAVLTLVFESCNRCCGDSSVVTVLSPLSRCCRRCSGVHGLVSEGSAVCTCVLPKFTWGMVSWLETRPSHQRCRRVLVIVIVSSSHQRCRRVVIIVIVSLSASLNKTRVVAIAIVSL